MGALFTSRRPPVPSAHAMPPCTCASDDALDWVRLTFRECVSTNAQLAGFYLGLLTIASWMCAQIPQLIINARTSSARGLSPWFLTQWLAGDAFNLIGCVATGDQAPTQTYTAVYFVLSDVALLTQYVYYEASERRAKKRSDDDEGGDLDGSVYEGLRESDTESDDDDSETTYDVRRGSMRAPLSPVGGFVLAGAAAASIALAATSRADGGASTSRLLMDDGLPPSDACDYNANPVWMQHFGRGVGYLAAVFYLGGRVAQIVKNARRKTVKGLSLTMFALAITANVSYGASVLFGSTSHGDTMRALPWLVGSFGTVALDATILAQSVVFDERRRGRVESTHVDVL